MTESKVAPATPSPNTHSHITTNVLTKLGELEKGFHVSDDTLKVILDRFIEELDIGLSTYGEALPMIPTFVTGTPTGQEVGTYLALDLGGTNLRVCEVTLKGNHQYELRQQKYKVSDTLKTGPATQLFDYMAECIDAFLTQINSHPGEISNVDAHHLGFTFSFPVEQTAIDKGTLLTWTKGFAATGAIGQDVVGLLQDALDRKHLHVKVTALVNDTVGTLLSRSYAVGESLLGAIFGTGTNAAYIDSIGSVKKLPESVQSRGGDMIVNTEWGAFDNTRKVLPFTIFDNKVDRESINPRKQAFEKFISGMYLGEIARNLILHLVDSLLLFKGYSTPKLNAHYGFDSAYMSEFEKEEERTPDFYARARKVLYEELAFPKEFEITEQDCDIIRWACEVVATRAARLSAVGVAAVVQKTGAAEKYAGDIHLGADGSLVEHYPHFESRLRIALKAMLGDIVEKKVKLGLAKDGSGVGAALGALQAKKDKITVEVPTLSTS